MCATVIWCPAERSIDISFHHLNGNEMPLLEELYRRGGVELTPKVRRRFQEYLDGNPRGKHGQIRYDLQRHFGVTADELRDAVRLLFRPLRRPARGRRRTHDGHRRFRADLSQPPGRRRDAPGVRRPGRADRPGLWCSPGLSNSYLLTTGEGRVIVNTGMGFEGPVHRANFDAVDSSPVRYIIFTQGHDDHVGGLDSVRDPDTTVVAQANWTHVARRQRTAHPVPRQPQRVRLQRHPGHRHPGHSAPVRHQAAARSEHPVPPTSSSTTR